MVRWRLCVGMISSGTAETRAEERRSCPRQSTECPRDACQSSPSTHVLLLVTLTNSAGKVIQTKQPHRTASKSPTRKSWTELWLSILGFEEREAVCRSPCCSLFLFSLQWEKTLGLPAAWQYAQGHAGVPALWLPCVCPLSKYPNHGLLFVAKQQRFNF